MRNIAIITLFCSSLTGLIPAHLQEPFKIIAVRFFAWGAFLKQEIHPGSTPRVEFDVAFSKLVTKIAGRVHANEYPKAVEEVEDFLIGKRLNALFEPRQVRSRRYSTRCWSAWKRTFTILQQESVDIGELATHAYTSEAAFNRTFKRVIHARCGAGKSMTTQRTIVSSAPGSVGSFAGADYGEFSRANSAHWLARSGKAGAICST